MSGQNGSGQLVSNRDLRRAQATQARDAQIQALGDAVSTALSNEKLTRQRVQVLEEETAHYGSAIQRTSIELARFRAQSFRGRLWWLLTGR